MSRQFRILSFKIVEELHVLTQFGNRYRHNFHIIYIKCYVPINGLIGCGKITYDQESLPIREFFSSYPPFYCVPGRHQWANYPAYLRRFGKRYYRNESDYVVRHIGEIMTTELDVFIQPWSTLLMTRNTNFIILKIFVNICKTYVYTFYTFICAICV